MHPPDQRSAEWVTREIAFVGQTSAHNPQLTQTAGLARNGMPAAILRASTGQAAAHQPQLLQRRSSKTGRARRRQASTATRVFRARAMSKGYFLSFSLTAAFWGASPAMLLINLSFCSVVRILNCSAFSSALRDVTCSSSALIFALYLAVNS